MRPAVTQAFDVTETHIETGRQDTSGDWAEGWKDQEGDLKEGCWQVPKHGRIEIDNYLLLGICLLESERVRLKAITIRISAKEAHANTIHSLHAMQCR